MSCLEQDKSQNFHVRFRFGGTKFRRSLRTKSRSTAESRLHRLDENIRLVESGQLQIPGGSDVATFLLSDGRLNGSVRSHSGMDLGTMFDEFIKALPEGALEQTTLNCIKTHRRHFERILGASCKIEQLSVERLQHYVTKRSKEPGQRGNSVGKNTIRKEIGTLGMVWQWAKDNRHIKGTFPKKGIRFPKEQEKPPFQTWQEIEKQIEVSNLDENREAELWDCLFLTLSEIEQVLEYLKELDRYPFMYPMVAMAAYTGARRSELFRSLITDVGDTSIVLRERKRMRGKRSFRRVPLAPKLREIMDDWFAVHPGGTFTLCKIQDGQPVGLNADDARGYYRRTFAGSPWKNIPGWHCFRHSFVSNCAMRGVDQRMIDSWVGHQTDEMRRRYRHLFPDSEVAAIRSVFN